MLHKLQRKVVVSTRKRSAIDGRGSLNHEFQPGDLVLEMALCDERLVALTSREVGVKEGVKTGGFRTTTIQNSDPEDELSIPNVFVLSFSGSFINGNEPFFKRNGSESAMVIHDNLSVRKLQAEPVQLNYLCGVSDFAEASDDLAEAYMHMLHAKLAGVALPVEPNPKCESNKTALALEFSPGVSVDTGS